MKSHLYFEKLVDRLWNRLAPAGTLVLLMLAAQPGKAQDNSQKVGPVQPVLTGQIPSSNDRTNGAVQSEWPTNHLPPGGEVNGRQSPSPTGNERVVVGKVTFADSNAPADLSHALVTLHSGVTYKMLERLRQTKTLEERLAIFQSAEYQKAIANSRQYAAKLSDNHSFKLTGVGPGQYEFSLQLAQPNEAAHSNSTTIFTSPREIVVPETAATNDDSPVDLGTLQLKKLTLPALPAQSAPN